MDMTPPTETPPTDPSPAPAAETAAAKPSFLTPNRVMFAIGGFIIIMMVIGAGMNVSGHIKLVKKCQTGDIAVCTALIEAKNTTEKQSGKLYALRGLHYTQKGEYEKALADFNSAIGTNTAEPAVYAYRANAYVKMANYGEAIKDFNTAIRMEPNVPDFVRCALIDAEYRKGDTAAGDADLQKLKSTMPQAACIAQLSPPAPAAPVQPVYVPPPPMAP